MLTLFAERVPARSVVILRVVIGLVSILRGIEEWRVMRLVFRPDIVRFPMFEFLPVIGARAATGFLVAWMLAACAFTIGAQVRLSGLVLAATMGTTLFIDQQLYFSHLYLLTLIVLLVALANPENRAETVIYWPVLLLKLQLSIVYIFAAVSKMNSQYLSGFMLAANFRKSLVFPPALLSAFAAASIFVEVFLAFALWSRRWRKPAVVIGVGFHAVMVFSLAPPVMAQLALFAVECIALYQLFFIPRLRSNDQTADA
jgi:hypothetical protein